MTAVPPPVARIAEVMSSFPARWCLCGGWAVDAILGGETRRHGDVDITIFEDDAAALYKHLAGWQLIAHDTRVPGNSAEPWNGRKLSLPAHIHGHAPDDGPSTPAFLVNPSEQGFDLEIVVNELSESGDWQLYYIPNEVHNFSREPLLTVPLGECTQESTWGFPTLTAQVLLFYKATAYRDSANYLRRRDHLDFDRLLPRLTKQQRSWLHDAIALVDADHPWLGVLAM